MKALLLVFLSVSLSGTLYAIDSWRSPFKSGKAVIDIGGDIKILTPGTSCQIKNWDWGNAANPRELSCRCCLIKASLRGNGRFQTDGNQVNFCKNKGQCTDKLIQHITSKHFGKDADPSKRELIEAVIEEAQQTKSVDTLHSITEANEVANLSPNGVGIVLKKLKILDPNKCYSVKKFGAGGANTLQLFGVYEHTPCGNGGVYNPDEGTKKLVYIVKGLAKVHEEVANLAKIRRSFLDKYNLEKSGRPMDFPALAMNVSNLKYSDSKGKVHYIAVLIAAPGEPLFELVRRAATSQGNEQKKAQNIAQEAFQVLGQQLGQLHMTYMTKNENKWTGRSRAIHGDLHTNNVFYDPEKKATTLIDIETMALALTKPRSIAVDLLRLYIYSTLHTKAQHNASAGISREDWHKDYIKPFLTEYVKAYAVHDGRLDRDKLKQIMKILRGIYLKPLTNVTDFVRTGVNSYYLMQRKYLKPILDSIESELMRSELDFSRA